jgi:hypothetical protein
MLACRPVGDPNLTLAAWGARDDVTFDTGPTVSVTHEANNVAWYFNSDWSWGFAPGGATVYKSSCDYKGGGAQTDPDKRMCWHLSSGATSDGFRCGSDETSDLMGSTTWERVIYHAN